MRVLLVTENQAAAVRVDRGQVDAVAAQQRQQKVRADVTEVAGNDAVKVPRLCAEILQQRGKGVGSSGEDGVLGLCGLSVLLNIVLCCRIGIRKFEFYRDFTAFVYINHVDQLNNDLARQRL